MNEKPFSVKIHWGSSGARLELPDNIDEYEFETQAELDAFMYGIDEMDGWHGYEIIEDEGE